MSYVNHGGQKISETLVNDLMKVEAGNKLIEFRSCKQSENEQENMWHVKKETELRIFFFELAKVKSLNAEFEACFFLSSTVAELIKIGQVSVCPLATDLLDNC